MSMKKKQAFTLLEMVVALGILGVVLVSLFQISSSAADSQSYARKLTVATLLARSKMADVEQQLQIDGFSATDVEDERGDFSEEGWPEYEWSFSILVPKVENLSPEQLLASFAGLPLEQTLDTSSIFSSLMPSGSAASTSMSAFAPLLAPLQTQFAQMVQTLTQQVREIRLKIEWSHRGKKEKESFEIRTHVLSQQMSTMLPTGVPPHIGNLNPGTRTVR
ncbi:MAG: type II secretion system GspH family protein [Cystobacterineae bacterium]|nr:type II secretion system GspH family protein [Cystobacterineae bacterium]